MQGRERERREKVGETIPFSYASFPLFRPNAVMIEKKRGNDEKGEKKKVEKRK